MREKIDYIDGIKGVGCLMVMLGHYYCIYSLAESFVAMPQVPARIMRLFSFFLDADLGLFIFALLSGFCIAMSKIDTFKKLVQTIIKRFLRFVLPVLGANIIIYFIYREIGFHNASTAGLFVNKWFQGYYQVDMWFGLAVRDSVATVLGTGAVFNPPFWVISYFFYSSVIIYIGNYLESKMPDKFKYILYLAELLLAAYVLGTNGFAIVLGAIWYKTWDNEFLAKIIDKRILSGAAIGCFILLSGGATWMGDVLGNNLFSNPWLEIIYAAVILYAISKIDVLKKVFSNRSLVALSKLSFGIYALHWPIICSITSLLFLACEFNAVSYFGIGIITVAVVFLFAIGYYFTVELGCGLFLKLLAKKRIL